MNVKTLLALLVVSCGALYADDKSSLSDDPLTKAAAMEAGRVDSSDRKLFEQSIQSTKQSLARETLDVFYRDALDFYHRAHYDEALDLLEKIYSIDPYYEDVATLRETVTRLKSNHDFQSKRSILEDFMKKGNQAQRAGQSIAAIGFWKQALQVNPSYEPAKRKIKEVNHAMAQKQYEAGYLYYHHGDMEEAMESWSNAIALDPSFKQRGLLLLMSKVELSLRREKTAGLSAQGMQQYDQKDLTGALRTYQDLIAIDPRNEEAKRMTSKIKIQLGQAAYRAGRDALGQNLYAQAIKKFQESIRYEYEVQRSQKAIQEAERQVQSEREERSKSAKAASKDAQQAAGGSPDQADAQTANAVPVKPAVTANPEEANVHYRESLAAIRNKDYNRAIQECEIASQLNPTDEHIYVACQRAKQEASAASSGRTTP